MDDCLFIGKVNNAKKEEYFKFFQAKDADSLRLIEESFDYFEKTNHKDIIKCLPPASHRFFIISDCFLEKTSIKKMALPHETLWSSEYYGDKRAHLLPLKLYSIKSNDLMPIVYDGRGCLHSWKWLDNVVNFLKGQNYSIDFSKQSLYDNDYQKSHWGVSWMIKCDGLKGRYLNLFITTFKVKNMLKERLHWIDIMRGMAMLFVVMQHMSAYLYYDYLYYKFITIVDIGIFFFVSGYILDKVVCLNSFYEVLIFILKKTIQLMVPFFVWGVIA